MAVSAGAEFAGRRQGSCVGDRCDPRGGQYPLKFAVFVEESPAVRKAERASAVPPLRGETESLRGVRSDRCMIFGNFSYPYLGLRSRRWLTAVAFGKKAARYQKYRQSRGDCLGFCER